MSVSLHLSKVGPNHTQTPYTIHKGSIAWKTIAVVGFIVAGIPSTQASCDSFTDIIKFSVIKPTLAWMFPDLARNEVPMPLDNLLEELGEICPVPNRCPVQMTELEEQALRINTAMFQASNDGERATYRIKHFGIKEQSSVIKILNHALEIRPIIFLIKRCFITNEADRISLARASVQKSSAYTLKHFKDFEIFKTSDQSALIAFIEYCADISARDTAEHFKNFEVRNPADRLKLAKYCFQLDPEAGRYAKNFQL